MPIPSFKVKHGEFKIKGTNKTMYTVIIGEWPSCTCLDFDNGNLCKHIKAVLLKKYNVPQNSHLLRKRRLTDDDLSGLGVRLEWIIRINPYNALHSSSTTHLSSSSTSSSSMSI
jgi:hypothetical protein